MAMLASKSPYPAPLSGVSSQSSASMQPSSNSTGRKVAQNVSMSNQQLASPTESEFSDSVDAPDSARNWDEQRVCDWLHTVNSGQYEKAFRRNNINGENLLELDKEGLKEIGVEKIGDRVRLFVGIKALRTKAYANTKKRNRVSIAAIRTVAPRLTGIGLFRGSGEQFLRVHTLVIRISETAKFCLADRTYSNSEQEILEANGRI